MVSRYKIKHRSQKHDRLPDGWFIYSRQFKSCANGRQGFRRRRISGAFKTKGRAVAAAGILALKMNEVKKRVKKYPEYCIKMPVKNRVTRGHAIQKAICVKCRRVCLFAGRPRIRKTK